MKHLGHGHTLTYRAHHHPHDGEEGGDLPAEEVAQKAQHQAAEGPCHEGHGEAEPRGHAVVLKEVPLEVRL